MTAKEVIDAISNTEKHLFYCPGMGPGRGFWHGEIEDRNADNGESRRRMISSNLLDRLAPWDISNLISQFASTPVCFLRVSETNPANERMALGLATVLGARFHYVTRFLTDADQVNRPIPEPVTPVDYSIPAAIIVDLDGTLLDSSHRPPYKASYGQIINDEPIHHVAYTVGLYKMTGHKVLFVSGRGHEYHEYGATVETLRDKFGITLPNQDFSLFMRQVGDNRSDEIVKLEIFNRHIRNKYHIKLVLDDRPRVIRMWHELGLPVLANKAYIRGEF